MKPYSVGDKVRFRFYNKPEGKFYGEIRTGVIKEIGNKGDNRVFFIELESGYVCAVALKEMRGRISERTH